MGRIPCCDKDTVKRGQWTPEEDAKLVSYISQHGTRNWRLIPKNAGLQRCGKSCRLRWTNYLRPDLKHGEFTDIEEQTIVKLHSVVGNRWSLIAAQLPGRTDNDVKNHWNTKLKKKLSGMGIDPVTHKPFSHLMAEIANTLAPPQVAHLAEAALGCFKDEMLHLLTKKRMDWRPVDQKSALFDGTAAAAAASPFSTTRTWDLPHNNIMCQENRASKDDLWMPHDNVLKQAQEQSEFIPSKQWETQINSVDLSGYNGIGGLHAAFQISAPLEYRYSSSMYGGGGPSKTEVFTANPITPWMVRGPGHLECLERTSSLTVPPPPFKSGEKQGGESSSSIWKQVECNDNGQNRETGSPWSQQSMCSGSTCTGGDRRGGPPRSKDEHDQEDEAEDSTSDGQRTENAQVFNSDCMLWDLSDDLITPIL